MTPTECTSITQGVSAQAHKTPTEYDPITKGVSAKAVVFLSCLGTDCAVMAPAFW